MQSGILIIRLIYGVMIMIASYCDLSEAYNRIISECYSKNDAHTKIRCAEYLIEYSKRKHTALEKADENFFQDYFMKWLPYKVYFEDRKVTESFYASAEEYIRLNDMLTGCSSHNYFVKLDPDIKFTSLRMLNLKSEIVQYNNSYIISKIPCVIDFDRYKAKRFENNDDMERDSGKFRAESFFRNNSVVFSKMDDMESYYIRLFFNKNIVGLLKENDILDIKILKKNDRWVLDDINGCYHPLEKI